MQSNVAHHTGHRRLPRMVFDYINEDGRSEAVLGIIERDDDAARVCQHVLRNASSLNELTAMAAKIPNSLWTPKIATVCVNDGTVKNSLHTGSNAFCNPTGKVL